MRKVSSMACLSVGGGGGSNGVAAGSESSPSGRGGRNSNNLNKTIDNVNYKTLLKKSPSRKNITKSLQREYPNDLLTMSQQTTRTTLLMEEEESPTGEDQGRATIHHEKPKNSKGLFRRSVRSCESLPGEVGTTASRRSSVSSSAFSLRRRSSLLSNGAEDGVPAEEVVHRQRYEKLQSYVKNQKWNKLLKVLEGGDNLAEFVLFCMTNEAMEGEDCGTLLHLACEQHPPVEVIECLFKLNPSWVSNSNNSQQQTPLHVAAQYGANPSVIDFLLEQDHSLAIERDVNGKTPLELHLEHTTDMDGTCDPSSFSKEEHDKHRQNRFDDYERRHDADMMFAEFMTVNAFRTYGPIGDVVHLLEEAAQKEQQPAPPTLVPTTPLPAPNNSSSSSSNVFASFLVNTTNPLEMSELFDPVAPTTFVEPVVLSKPSLGLEDIKREQKIRKEKKNSSNLFSSSSSALFGLTSSNHKGSSKASFKSSSSKTSFTKSSTNSSFSNNFSSTSSHHCLLQTTSRY